MNGEKMIREDLEPLYQFIDESLGRSVVIKDFAAATAGDPSPGTSLTRTAVSTT